MARKKRRGKQAAWRKYARMAVGLVGAAIGVVVATSPTHRGLKAMLGGDFEGGARQISIDTVGVDPAAPAIPSLGKIMGTGLVVGVGIGLMVLFRRLARRI